MSTGAMAVNFEREYVGSRDVNRALPHPRSIGRKSKQAHIGIGHNQMRMRTQPTLHEGEVEQVPIGRVLERNGHTTFLLHIDVMKELKTPLACPIVVNGLVGGGRPSVGRPQTKWM
jgi:hypothetical protein